MTLFTNVHFRNHGWRPGGENTGLRQDIPYVVTYVYCHLPI
jgi:hypothetical protein